jgi:hypothetical protein
VVSACQCCGRQNPQLFPCAQLGMRAFRAFRGRRIPCPRRQYVGTPHNSFDHFHTYPPCSVLLVGESAYLSSFHFYRPVADNVSRTHQSTPISYHDVSCVCHLAREQTYPRCPRFIMGLASSNLYNGAGLYPTYVGYPNYHPKPRI